MKAGRFGTVTDQEDKDLLGFWEQSETFRCTDGCQTLLKRMVTKLNDPKGKFKFTLMRNTEVTKIETDSLTSSKPVELQWKSTAAVTKVDAAFDFVILRIPVIVNGQSGRS